MHRNSQGVQISMDFVTSLLFMKINPQVAYSDDRLKHLRMSMYIM